MVGAATRGVATRGVATRGVATRGGATRGGASRGGAPKRLDAGAEAVAPQQELVSGEGAQAAGLELEGVREVFSGREELVV